MEYLTIVDRGETIRISGNVDSLVGVNLALNAIFSLVTSDGLPRSVVVDALRACANDIER